MKKVYKISLFIIISLGITSGLLIGLRKLLNKQSKEINTYKVKKESYENVIEISGTVKAAQEQNLQALSSGTVLGVYVKEGDRVKKGSLILQLDDTSEQYNLAKHDYDMATTKINGSSRELKLKETQRLSLLQKIEDRKIIAAFDGVIAELNVAKGDFLEAKDSVGSLVNVDYLISQVEIAETDVSKLKIGQEVSLDFNAYNKTVKGYVESWPAIGKISSRGATIVNAKIRIDDYPPQILPYFSFTGKILVEKAIDNIIVERYAIAYENKKPYVVLAKTGEKIEVEISPYGRDYVKVKKGLTGGEILLQQEALPKSGQNRNKENSNKTVERKS